MSESLISSINSVVTVLNDSIENPAQFVEPQLQKSQKFKHFTKLLFNFKSKLKEESISKCLPKLITKGFDVEGIWQQLELLNNVVEKHYEVQFRNFNNTATVPSTEDTKHDIETSDDDENEDEDVDSADSEEYAFDDEDSDEDSEVAIKETKDKKTIEKEKKPVRFEDETEVDDQFFKLRRMEQFLNVEDAREMQQNDPPSSSDESDDIDMFADVPSDDGLSESDNDDDDRKILKSHRELMYSDFFDPPGDGEHATFDEIDSDHEVGSITKNKNYDTRDYDPSLDDNNHNEQDHVVMDKQNDDGGETHVEETVPLTPFEKQQEKEKKKIQRMEDSMLQPKPWQLTGEVAASSRPEDSLVHQPLTFDSNTKQDLLSTDELTTRIEQIVKNAIMNKAYNDVERKVKPIEDPRNYRKPIELDQNKSKKGLAEVYEEEYVKLHTKSEDNQEDPKHTEIKKLMDVLMPELQALFAFIPKPPIPEIRAVNNMPAITVEEVGPVALSDAALLAPEEVKKKLKGAVKSQDERTDTDRKRERRKKKVYQKLKQKKLVELAASNPAIAKKHEKLLALRKLKQNRNTQIVTASKGASKLGQGWVNALVGGKKSKK